MVGVYCIVTVSLTLFFICLNAGNWATVLQDAYNECAVQASAASGSSGQGTASLSAFAEDFYRKLSQDIHGKGWDPKSMKLSRDLNDVERCFLVKILKHMRIDVPNSP